MKVLLINNFLYRKGGSETVFFNTSDLLTEEGHEVVFFSYEDELNIQTGKPEYLISKGGRLSRVRDYFSNKKAASCLEQLIIQEKPDIAHAHLFWGGISPSIFKVLKKYNIPLVHTAHDYRMICPAYLLKDGKGNLCERCKGGKFYFCARYRCSKGNAIESLLMAAEMYYRNCHWHPANSINGIIFVSNFSKKKHIEFDEKFANTRSIVLYNCPSEIIRDSHNISYDTYNSYYLYYGRLSEEKGVLTLIKAFESFPGLNLKIVGSGPLEKQLKEYCKSKKISNIDFLGYKTGKELFDVVACAKYVCVPSECYENNPMTIVEAYSLGVPVIGAAIGGISEVVIENSTGFSFTSGSIESLAEALRKASALGQNEYNRQKQDSYVFGTKHFSRENHKALLINFYKEVLDGNQG